MMDHDEIQEIMGQSYGMDDVDEDDLEAGAPASVLLLSSPLFPASYLALRRLTSPNALHHAPPQSSTRSTLIWKAKPKACRSWTTQRTSPPQCPVSPCAPLLRCLALLAASVQHSTKRDRMTQGVRPTIARPSLHRRPHRLPSSSP